MIKKLTFPANLLGIALWCGAATSGYAADVPAQPVPAVVAIPSQPSEAALDRMGRGGYPRTSRKVRWPMLAMSGLSAEYVRNASENKSAHPRARAQVSSSALA
jgi:hypothetical protein